MRSTFPFTIPAWPVAVILKRSRSVGENSKIPPGDFLFIFFFCNTYLPIKRSCFAFDKECIALSDYGQTN